MTGSHSSARVCPVILTHCQMNNECETKTKILPFVIRIRILMSEPQRASDGKGPGKESV
jgi:hypothetical protein